MEHIILSGYDMLDFNDCEEIHREEDKYLNDAPPRPKMLQIWPLN